MKKKTLVILLIIPFVIGLLTFVSIQVLNITMTSDILDISFAYKENEGFKIREEGYLLEATPVVDENVIITKNADVLTWTTSSTDGVIEIKEENGSYYLYALKEGEAKVTCANVSGSKEKSFTAHVYENGLVVINNLNKRSGTELDSTLYYGEYDMSYDSNYEKSAFDKVAPIITLETEVYADEAGLSNECIVYETSSNLSAKVNDSGNIEVTINSANLDENNEEIDSYVTLATKEAVYYTQTYKFRVIKDAVNVYNYNDLLKATNYSENGEKVVLQTSLGSIKEVYSNVKRVGISGNEASDEAAGYIRYEPVDGTKNDNIELFGNYDFNSSNTNKFSFKDEVYRFATTYNHEFIDDYNASGVEDSAKASLDVLAGVHVQKDFYGNGYTINANELCFPNYGSVDTVLKRLAPGSDDTFFGPLAFVTIGSPKEGENLSLIKAYGQDNVGLYIDGDNITVNDLKFRNTNDNINRANLTFSGSVVDVNGDNVTIKNSIFSHGKNIVRAFSSDNLLLEKCILKTSGEFNLYIGSNEYIKPDETKSIDISYAGLTSSGDYKTYFDTATTYNYSTGECSDTELVSDNLFMRMLAGENSSALYDALSKTQGYLDNAKGIYDDEGNVNYDAVVTCKDVLFGDSGIFSVALDTMFNGCFLYNGMPSLVLQVLTMLGSVPPSNIAGTSKPVKLVLEGKTNFYDYKNIENIIVDCLVGVALSEGMASILGVDDLSVDDFFPMKTVLKAQAKSLGYVYTQNGVDYINSCIAYYGGGKNLSTVEIASDTKANMDLSDNIEVDLLKNSMNNSTGLSSIMRMLSNCVLFAAGFNPFNFVTNGKIDSSADIDELINKVPQLSDLKEDSVVGESL